jgi:hypothetical protein
VFSTLERDRYESFQNQLKRIALLYAAATMGICNANFVACRSRASSSDQPPAPDPHAPCRANEAWKERKADS